jgi:hypothetical protein
MLATLAENENENEIPGDEFAQGGDAHHPFGPARVVARQRVDEVGVRARRRPSEDAGHRDGEQALAEPILRRLATARSRAHATATASS